MELRVGRRKVVSLALVGFSLLVFARFVYRCQHQDERILGGGAEFASLAVSGQAERPDASPALPEDIAYDFRTMMQLVEVARQIKGDAACGFGQVARRQRFDRVALEQLNQELTRERASLNNYIWELKAHAAGGIPIKRYRSLLYYIEVLDQMIIEMRLMINKESK